MLTNITPKNPLIFECIQCLFKCCNKKDYNRHILTRKHKMLTNVDKENSINPFNFRCECGKEYNHRQSLSIHKKKCKLKVDSENESEEEKKPEEEKKLDEITDKELIMMVVKQNAELIKDNNELRTMIMKVLENGTNNTTNNTTHTNSYNKTFNLNLFLNETCKDAMNIMDFVDSIKLQLNDLENVGELGYVEGISNIIVKNLKELDVTQRPVHCTDKKRETIYVKDENKWEKDEENKKMHKMVRKITDKNFKMIQKFKEKYPDYNKASSRHSDTYNNIIIESMGGRGDNDFEKEERIIKKVSKEVVVEK